MRGSVCKSFPCKSKTSRRRGDWWLMYKGGTLYCTVWFLHRERLSKGEWEDFTPFSIQLLVSVDFRSSTPRNDTVFTPIIFPGVLGVCFPLVGRASSPEESEFTLPGIVLWVSSGLGSVKVDDRSEHDTKKDQPTAASRLHREIRPPLLLSSSATWLTGRACIPS